MFKLTNEVPLQEYSGKVETVRYYNEDTGGTIMYVRIGCESVGVKCTLPIKVPDDQEVKIKGISYHDKKYGKQIKASSVELVDPTSRNGILAYLSAGTITGIGPSTAQRICEAFGDQSLQVLDDTPERLLEIRGIGAKSLQKIVSSWKERREGFKIVAALFNMGLSQSAARKTYKKYEGAALQVVRDNPYRLAEEISGIGFKTADDIAKKLGYTQEHPFRISAGIIHCLKEAQSDGHCHLPEDKLLHAAGAILDVQNDIITSGLSNLVRQEKLFQIIPEAFVKDIPPTPAYYLIKIFNTERAIENRLKAIMREFRKDPGIHIKLDRSLTQEQADAVEASVGGGPVTIITGSAGTGKTTTLKAIIKCLEDNSRTYCLCAPTGKAAKRIEEVTERTAQTIHRLLGLGRGRESMRNADNPLEEKWVICDEASMIDLFLMAALVEAVPWNGRIIFIGDPYQLQPVNAGAPFSDLIYSGLFTVVTLTQIHRQEETSDIITVANEIKDNIVPVISNTKDVYFFEIESPDKMAETVVDLALNRISSKFGIPFSEIQVLSPIKKGVVGVENLNLLIQDRVHPPGGPELKGFRLGDKVRQTVNDYNINVFNGDSGFINHIDLEEKKLYVTFDGISESIEYDINDMENLTLNFVSTVHSAQGSQSKSIVVVVSMAHIFTKMIRSTLLYTASTRARKLLVFCGSKKALAIGVSQKDTDKRYTGLFKLKGDNR